MKREEEEPLNLHEMAEEAEKLGYTDDHLERITERLWRKCERDWRYVLRRRARGHQTSHDEVTVEDMLVIAKAITLLEQEKGAKG